ncbi:CST complex subunit CTC1 isoform X4 [Willisornis vidua]|uniref:CST complex subunit CTC1 n=1 Tax=Willisornis vidua TaxID=1566151 RepID=A0ABQ9CQ38_9PASS|nr:CST complex subunit CTC1 isoform X4 [Willisornis vidua]
MLKFVENCLMDESPPWSREGFLCLSSGRNVFSSQPLTYSISSTYHAAATSPGAVMNLKNGFIKDKEPSQLAWYHVLQLGHRYTVTGLSMSSLKNSGQRIFVTSVSSCLLPYCAEQVREQPLDSSWQGESTESSSLETAEQLSGSLELGVEKEGPRATKESKIISYVGFVTKILNVQAGLFLLDNQVCLCLAYQPMLKSARGLRPGACVELIDVHLLQKPLVSFPFVVLGACLSSTVVLKSFSRLSTLYQPPASSGNLCLQLLFRYNLGMPLYLWLVSLLEMFEERFSFFFGRRRLLSSTHQNPGAAEKFLVPLLEAMVPDREEARDIYKEILSKVHQCPLQKYSPLNPPCQALSLSAVCHVAEQKSWESFSPSQLLSPTEAQHMGTQELNRRLAWSYCTLSAGSFQPRLVVLGVLRVSSRSSSLQLQDKTGTLPCVISHKDGSPFAHTALLGSLLQVENYQLVVERFLQTDFPSWEHLENPEHVRMKKISVYLQFYFEDAKVLHAAEGQIQKGLRSGNSSSLGKKKDGSITLELETPEAKMLKLEDPKPDTHRDENCQGGQSSTGTTSCVSHLFLVTQKEGLMLRNYQLPREGQELQRSFQTTVLWLGKPQMWSHPREIRNLPELEESGCDQEEGTTQREALLLFMGKSLRWFPFLHQDGLYRFIVPCCSLAARTVLTGMDQRITSIPEVLSRSFTGSLVSFFGEIVERTLCASPKNEKPSVTVGLPKQEGNLLASDHSVKLSVSVAPGSPVVMDIYIIASYLQHLWGLLPGAKILFQNLERRISRVLVEDGTGEAVVLCRNKHVAAMLGLSLPEWEALQNCVQSRGSVSIHHGEATGTGCLEEPEDLVACYLRSLCRSPLICRPILLDFSLDRKPSKLLRPAPPQLRNFRCGEVEFVSRVAPRPSLLCLNVEEVEQDALRYLNSERMMRR